MIENTRGSFVIYSLMVGMVILILALALAPAIADFTGSAMNSTSTTYNDYNDLREWDIYAFALVNGTYKLNNTDIELYQKFEFPPSLYGTYYMMNNITLTGRRVGNPTGTITVRIVEGNNPHAVNTVNFSTSAAQPITNFGATTTNVTFTLPAASKYYINAPYYMVVVNVTGVDNSDYLLLGTTNVTPNLFYDEIRLFNTTSNVITTTPENLDLLFRYSVRDGGVTTGGLDCDNSSISNFDKATCIATDLMLFYFIGFLIFLAGAVITAKFVFGED